MSLRTADVTVTSIWNRACKSLRNEYTHNSNYSFCGYRDPLSPKYALVSNLLTKV